MAQFYVNINVSSSMLFPKLNLNRLKCFVCSQTTISTNCTEDKEPRARVAVAWLRRCTPVIKTLFIAYCILFTSSNPFFWSVLQYINILERLLFASSFWLNKKHIYYVWVKVIQNITLIIIFLMLYLFLRLTTFPDYISVFS